MESLWSSCTERRSVKKTDKVRNGMLRTHQPTEALEGSWYSDMGVDLNQNTFCSVDIDLKKARLIEGRIK